MRILFCLTGSDAATSHNNPVTSGHRRAGRARRPGLLAIAGLLLAGTAQAAMINVDRDVVNPTDGDGFCSLVEAVNNANDTSGAPPSGDCPAGDTGGTDTLVLPENSNFTFATANYTGNRGPTALPAITSTVIIQGNGSTIERSSSAGPFRLILVETSGSLTLRNSIVSGGQSDTGGGLLNRGILTLFGATVSNNTATGSSGSGGGISNPFISGSLAMLTVTNSRISGNTAASGGGIDNRSILNMAGTGITGNTATSGGGGIANFQANANATITGSTLSGNTTTGDTGGFLMTSGSTASISNSTVSGNRGRLFGGIRNLQSTLSLSFTTVANNFVDNQSVGVGGLGSIASGGTVVTTVANSLLVNNDNRNCLHEGTFNVVGTNFATSTNLCSEIPTNAAAGNIGPLAFNGGPLQTHALLAGSPAIDATAFDGNGSCGGLFADQRGVARPINGGVALACDVGAFEFGTALDLGDAPDPTYPTLLANNGAAHATQTSQVNNLRLGSSLDFEAEGQQSANADGDDNNGDDEDGVVITGNLVPGTMSDNNINVTVAPGNGRLNAWIDFNADGDWNDAGEQIFTDMNVSAGSFDLSFPVPANAMPGKTFGRFRLSRPGGSTPTGIAPTGLVYEGEVEDHVVNIGGNSVSIGSVSQSEGNSGGGNFSFPLTLDSAADSDVTVNYRTADGTAQAPSDYSSQSSGTVRIPAGATRVFVNVFVNGDTDIEPDETFSVILTNVSGGGVVLNSNASTATGTILNDDQPSVSLSLSNASFDENGGTTDIIATLSQAVSSDIDVFFSLGGSATRDTDYGIGGTLIRISAGTTSGKITLTGQDDTEVEGDETVIATITSAPGATIGTPSAVTATITDDEVAPNPVATLSVAGSPFSENGSTATVVATLDKDATDQVTLALTFSGSASSSDYSASAQQIRIAPGGRSGSITLTGVDDAVFEGDEMISVRISEATNADIGTPASFTATITDDETAPAATVVLANAQVSEAAGTLPIQVRLSTASANATTVALTYGGSATRNSDYTAPNSVVVPAQSTSASFNIQIIDDTATENDETVQITATPPQGAAGSAMLTILKNDQPPPVATLAVVGSPFSENGGSANVTATLDRAADVPVTLTLAFSGNASASDYRASAQQITIPANSRTGSISLTGVDDAIFEGDETVSVKISGATNATIGTPDEITATITDDETTPGATVVLANAQVSEAAGTVPVEVRLSTASATATTVALTYGGSATRNSDYTAPDSVVVPAQATSASFNLVITDDSAVEPNETIQITATPSQGAAGNATLTIVDNDQPPPPPPPAASLAVTGSPFGENGGTATVTATLNRPATDAVTLSLAFDGSASASDYTATSQQIQIPAGQSSGTIQLRGVDDALFEGNETVRVRITAATNATIGTPNSITATITDDEAAPGATVVLANAQVSEDAGTVPVEIRLSQAPANATTVALTYAGSATRNSDYTAPNSVVIPAQATSASFNLVITDDTAAEPDESIQITATPPQGAAGNASLTILANDAVTVLPVVNLSIDQSTIAEDGGQAVVTATLDQASDLPVTLSLSYSGQAVRNTDYTGASDTLTIAAGDTSATLQLSAIDDFIDESNESIGITLTAADNAQIGASSTAATSIIDDDGAPSMSLSTDAAAIAENGGQATITATLSNPASQTISVNLSVGGPATAGTDFTLADTSLRFPAGATQASTTLSAVDDSAHEADEQVVIALAADTPNPGQPASVSVVITDDDEPAPGEPRLDQSPPVAAATIAAGARQVPALSFGLLNAGVEAALLDRINTTLVSASTARATQARLYLDSSGDGQIQRGEPLIAQTGDIGADGALVFSLSAPLSVGAGRTLYFLVTIDTAE